MFEQQSNALTYDHGLQALLRDFHRIVMTIAGVDVPLSSLDFTMNFSSAVTATNKRYSVRLLYPIAATIDMMQHFGVDMQMSWEVIWNGQRYCFSEQGDLTSGPPPDDLPPIDPVMDRPARVIDLE